MIKKIIPILLGFGFILAGCFLYPDGSDQLILSLLLIVGGFNITLDAFLSAIDDDNLL